MHLFCQTPGGLHNFTAGPVTQSQCQSHDRAGRRGGSRFLQMLLHFFRELRQVPDGLKSYLLFLHLLDFLFEIPAEQLHQGLDLELRALPVFF